MHCVAKAIPQPTLPQNDCSFGPWGKCFLSRLSLTSMGELDYSPWGKLGNKERETSNGVKLITKCPSAWAFWKNERSKGEIGVTHSIWMHN